MESSLPGGRVTSHHQSGDRETARVISQWLELSPGICAVCGESDEGDDEGDGRFSATSGFSLRTVDLLCCPSAVNSHFSAHQQSNVGRSKTLVLSSLCAVRSVSGKRQESSGMGE